jgi:hypothetical protein
MMKYHELYQEMATGAAHRSLPGWAFDRLSAVADGSLQITAVRHPLGFVCLPIERTGVYGVCVHIWSAGRPAPEPTTSQIHCHSWDLLSYILYGRLRNELAIVSDAVSGATHRVCEVISSEEHDDIRPTPRVVRHTGSVGTEHGTGEVYSLPAGDFHSSSLVTSGGVATVALGHGRRDGIDLSLGPLGTRRHRVTRARCGREETAAAARTAAGRIPHKRA